MSAATIIIVITSIICCSSLQLWRLSCTDLHILVMVSEGMEVLMMGMEPLISYLPFTICACVWTSLNQGPEAALGNRSKNFLNCIGKNKFNQTEQFGVKNQYDG